MRTILAAVVAAALLPLGTAVAQAEPLTHTYADLDDSPALMNEVAAAVEEVAQQFPEIAGLVVTTERLQPDAYGGAIPGHIAINDHWASDPVTMQRNFDVDVAEGFHKGGCTVGRYLAFHESAHQIDYAHLHEADYEVLATFGNGTQLHGQLSGYSFDELGILNPPEALADAFAAVWCGSAGPADYKLYGMLVS